MRLGLLADIHERNAFLQRALIRFDKEAVDQVVVLGDLFELGERIEETCRLLDAAGAVGVWGNHDFGICRAPEAWVRAKYSDSVFEFLARLRPHLEVDDCLFTHVEPWLDAEKIEDLWYFEGPPDTREKAARSFNAVPHRFLFLGHLHRWLVATPRGILDWDGRQPIQFSCQRRYLSIIAAVCDGRYAVFDTKTLELRPFDEQ